MVAPRPRTSTPHPGQPQARRAGGRVRGLDLARFLAIVGMVLVHADTDIVQPPPQAAAGMGMSESPAPAPLEWLQAALTDRARPLFFLLAGVGVSLMVARRHVPGAVLLRRAGFLTALGVLLALLGWSDVVLVFYGFLFCLAPLLRGRSSRALLVVAVACSLPAVLLLAQQASRDDTLGNVAVVVGEVLGVFCVGLVVGRLPLDSDDTARWLARWGAVGAAPGSLVLAGRNSLDLRRIEGAVELAAAWTSTLGLCLLVLAACLRIGPPSGRLRSLLVTAGGMPLTAYVGHALLFPVIARHTELALPTATAVAVGYLVVVVVVATWWRTRWGSGPVEAAMRRVSGPGPDRG